MKPISEVFNINNMEYMKTIPDKFFDLVIADPEYGIGTGDMAYLKSKRPVKQRYTNNKLFTPKTIYKNYDWDNKPPEDKYFSELKRVSKNQIIWGANYFTQIIGGMLVWDKLNGETSFSDGEIAYSSFNNKTEIFYFMWSGMIQGVYCGSDFRKALIQQGDKSKNEARIHPTQKPVIIYKYLLGKYAKQGDKIFDPNMGSQSSRIAAYDMGFDYYGCELDKDYFEQGNKRFESFKLQLKLL